MIEIIQKIISLFEDKTVAQGDFIFRTGESDPHFYIITSGKVEITQATTSQIFKSLAILHAGEFFGEGALSRDPRDHIRPANATALTEVNLMVLPRDKFNALLKNDPETASSFLYSILETTYSRLRNSNAEILTLYEVGRLIGIYFEDLPVLAQKILYQLKEATNSEQALMVIYNNLTGIFEVVGQIGDFTDLKLSNLAALPSGIFNLSEETQKYEFARYKILCANLGNLGYILLFRSQKERDYNDANLKLLLSAGEQAQAAIERARKIKEEKAKKLYNQRKQEFTF